MCIEILIQVPIQSSEHHWWAESTDITGDVIGLIGATIAFFALLAAKNAGKAAKKAGRGVHSLNILLEISEFDKLCQIPININREDANKIIFDIQAKVSRILGYFREEQIDEDNTPLKEILKDIDGYRTKIRDSIAELNSQPTPEGTYVYDGLITHLLNVSSSLHQLSGVMQKDLNNS
jgi:hypothetical protein